MTTYSTGTISVGAGSTAVTGVGTSWATAGLRAGDRLIAAGLVGLIATVNSATSITLKRAWPGAALSGASYDIELVDDGVRSLIASNLLLQSLGGGTLTSLGALTGGANKAPYWTGSGVMAEADQTAAGRAVGNLSGTAASGKLPVLTSASASALRDVLGTVGLAGAGALFETNANANGRFMKMADGTMIAWGFVTTDGAASVTWTYPAAFATAPAIFMGAGAASARHATYQTITTTTVQVNGWTDAGGRAAVPVQMLAIGRWA